MCSGDSRSNRKLNSGLPCCSIIIICSNSQPSFKTYSAMESIRNRCLESSGILTCEHKQTTALGKMTGWVAGRIKLAVEQETPQGQRDIPTAAPVARGCLHCSLQVVTRQAASGSTDAQRLCTYVNGLSHSCDDSPAHGRLLGIHALYDTGSQQNKAGKACHQPCG